MTATTMTTIATTIATTTAPFDRSGVAQVSDDVAGDGRDLRGGDATPGLEGARGGEGRQSQGGDEVHAHPSEETRGLGCFR